MRSIRQPSNRITIKVEFILSHCTPKTRELFYKPEGMVTIARGAISGRSVEVESTSRGDKLGRWTATHMRCKGNKKLSIISTYKVIHSIHL